MNRAGDGDAVWRAPLDAVRARRRQLQRTWETRRELPWLWVPPLLRASERARIARIVEGVHRALVVVADVAAASDELVYPANAQALAPPGDAQRAPLECCRLDAVYDPSTGALGFVELQAGDPSGPGFSDIVTRGLEDAGVLDALDAPAPLVTAALRDVLLSRDAPADALVVLAATATPLVRIDHDAIVAELIRLGTRARHVAPRSLTLTDRNTLLLDGERVDAIVRDAPDDLDDVDARALAAALPRVRRYLNPLRDARLDDKRCFAMLRDARVQARLDEEARALVERHVPETIALDGDGAALRRISGERAQWVVKPALGYGGHGVVVGRDVDDDAWRAALERARVEPMVAQRALPVQPWPWPVLDDDGSSIEIKARYTTWSFWVHGGRFTHAFVRAGTRPVVNVHQGGGIGPVLFARPP